MKRAIIITSFHMISHSASPLCYLSLDFCCIQVTHKGTFHKLRWHCSVRHGDVLLAAPGNYWNNLHYLLSGLGRLIWGWRKRCGSTWSIYQALAAISDPPKFDAKMRQKSWHAHKSIQHQSMITLVKHAWFVNQSPASSGAQHYIWLQSRPSTVLQNL